MSDVEIRELGGSDEDLGLYADAVLRLMPVVWDLTLEDQRWWERLAGPQLRIVHVAPDGSHVGCASATGMPNDPNSPIHASIVLDRDWTGRGIGTHTLARVEKWAAARRRPEPSLRVGVDGRDAGALAWWARRGFHELDRFVITELDLAATAPAIEDDLPRDLDGLEFTDASRRPDLLRAAYDASCEFRVDMPGEPHEPLPFEEFVALIEQGERPVESILLALDGDRIAGVCTLVLAGDRRRAHTGFTGIARDWRGRGVAAALKARQVEWCRSAGLTTLRTSNHDDNAAMRAVNDRIGFRVAHESVTLARSGPPTRE